MSTSVAMCTYNGAKYIEEQLLSILNQSERVDEIVVCDDGSTDQTLFLIEQLRTKIENAGVVIRVEKNSSSLGVNANFEKAIGLCHGDIVFLSDQDDVWEVEKVKNYVAYFENNPDKQVVFGNAWLIDNDGKRLTERTLLDVAGFTKSNQQYFDKGFAWELWCQENRATGATMALRRPFAQGMSMTVGNIKYHDAVLAIEALKTNSLGYIMEPLTRYRRYHGQESGDWDYNATYNDNLFLPALPHFDFRARGVDDEVMERIQFMKERFEMKWKWFGLASIKNVLKYRRLYGANWKKFIVSDINISVTHSLERIKNICKRWLKQR